MPAELKIMVPPAWKCKLIACRGQEGGDPSPLPAHAPPTQSRHAPQDKLNWACCALSCCLSVRFNHCLILTPSLTVCRREPGLVSVPSWLSRNPVSLGGPRHGPCFIDEEHVLHLVQLVWYILPPFFSNY